jgi:putative endonuclease
LIAREGDAVVFVEVKTRATSDFGTPDEAVDTEKRRRIFRAASEYLRRTEASWENARFDIVTVLFGAGEEVEHLKDAFARPRSL